MAASQKGCIMLAHRCATGAETDDLHRRRPPPPFRLAAYSILRAAVRSDLYRAGVGGKRAHTLIASGWTPPLGCMQSGAKADGKLKE